MVALSLVNLAVMRIPVPKHVFNAIADVPKPHPMALVIQVTQIKFVKLLRFAETGQFRVGLPLAIQLAGFSAALMN